MSSSKVPGHEPGHVPATDFLTSTTVSPRTLPRRAIGSFGRENVTYLIDGPQVVNGGFASESTAWSDGMARQTIRQPARRLKRNRVAGRSI
jgi:hypothetical protein